MRRLLCHAVAWAFLDGEWSPPSMSQRGRNALGVPRARWLTPLAERVVGSFPEPPHDRADELVAFIDSDRGFDRAFVRNRGLRPVRIHAPVVRMPVRDGSSLVSLATTGDLARWLGLSVAELEWFADRRHLNPRAGQGPLDHYRRWWIRKRGDRFRLIEAPKPTMRELQRSLLRDVLAAEPPHEAAHGFVTGRSVLTHASLHSARRTLVVLDLEDFFSTISEARVRGVFRSMGYPREVAGSLAGLCTTVAPKDVLDQMQRMSIASSTTSQRSQRARLAAPHLPQGAPTSPALSNLCARRLDARLSGLAASRGATYSRYADDLAFSGDGGLSHGIDELIALIAAIAADEGFAVNFRKTRVMRSGRRQRLTGLVVNKHPNVQRSELDQLKAILTNCVRHGPESQNRAQRPDFRAFLEGKVSWVEAVNPHRGRRLRELLEAVRW